MQKQLIAWAFALVISNAATAQSTLYVDDDAPTGGDGLSWSTAFSDLHDALDTARLPDSPVTEIHIAQGTYKPAPPNGDTGLAFQLVDNVPLIGGYAGIMGDDPDARDHDTFVTTLSGDLNGDSVWSNCCLDIFRDTPGCDDSACEALVCDQDPACCEDVWDFQCRNLANSLCDSCGTRSDDAVGVAYANELDGSYELDGLSVEFGNGILSGGGLSVQRSTITVRNCRFRWNQSRYGAGVYATQGAAVVIEDSVFEENLASLGGEGTGGGLFTSQAEVQLSNCLFLRNHAASHGGGGLPGFVLWYTG